MPGPFDAAIHGDGENPDKVARAAAAVLSTPSPILPYRAAAGTAGGETPSGKSATEDADEQARLAVEVGSCPRGEPGGLRSAARIQHAEGMRVFGSDGDYVGVVDRIDGKLIKLKHTVAPADGRQRAIPTNWVAVVDDVVRLKVTAMEARSGASSI